MSEYKKHKDSCVNIDIHVECDRKDNKRDYKKESYEENSYRNDYKNDYYEDNYYNKGYNNNYKKEYHEEDYYNKKPHKDAYSCVNVNVFAKCNKCKRERIKHFNRYEEKY